jgi:protein O-GlcNAc transferase
MGIARQTLVALLTVPALWAAQPSVSTEGLRMMPRAVAQDTKAKYHNDLGDKLFGQKKFDEALEQYKLSNQMDPSFWEPYQSMGAILALKSGNCEEAKPLFYKALSLHENPLSYGSIAWCLNKEKNFHEAVRMATKAIELDPKQATSYNERGAAHAGMNDSASACRDYSTAIQLNPNFSMAKQNFAFRCK